MLIDYQGNVRILPTEIVTFWGHPLVTALHKTTIMITKEDYVTSNGDCVVGVSANKACRDLTSNVKTALRSNNAEVEIMISICDQVVRISAQGCSTLTLDDPIEMVIRKSGYSSSRTLAVCADTAAFDLQHNMVERLRGKMNRGTVLIKVRDRLGRV